MTRFLSLLLCFSLFFTLNVAPQAQGQTAPASTPPIAKSLATNLAPQVPPRAIAYQRTHYLLSFGQLGGKLLGLWLLLFTGLSLRMRRFVYRCLRLPTPTPASIPPLRALVVYFLLLNLLFFLWLLPFGLAGFGVEHHYGFSQQSLAGFLGDSLLHVLFGMITLPLWLGGYWLISRSPKHWWQWLWLLLIPLLLLQFVLQPVLIAPAYNKFTPLTAGPLRDHILALAKQAGITEGKVFVEDTSRRTKHVNAYVTGVGPTTRIVLNDTALQTLPEDQILAMMGHEMGHYVEGHLWVQFFAGVFGAGVFLWLAAYTLPKIVSRWKKQYPDITGITDLAMLPAMSLVISLFLLAQSPIESGISRTLEHRADAFGLRVTHLNEATARLFISFAERDFSDPDPPVLLQFWFGSHPTLKERIAFAHSYQD